MGTVKYAYVRNHKGTPVGIVAFSVTNEIIRYGTATHCPTDKFDRAEGRRISTIRLEQKPFEVSLPKDGTVFTALVKVLMSVRHNGSLPKRLRWNARKTLRSMRRKIVASAASFSEGVEVPSSDVAAFDSLTRGTDGERVRTAQEPSFQTSCATVL